MSKETMKKKSQRDLQHVRSLRYGLRPHVVVPGYGSFTSVKRASLGWLNVSCAELFNVLMSAGKGTEGIETWNNCRFRCDFTKLLLIHNDAWFISSVTISQADGTVKKILNAKATEDDLDSSISISFVSLMNNKNGLKKTIFLLKAQWKLGTVVKVHTA